jgi:hypothetical protein
MLSVPLLLISAAAFVGDTGYTPLRRRHGTSARIMLKGAEEGADFEFMPAG